MENAGAERGLLVLNVDGSPQAAIAAQSNPRLVTKRIDKPLDLYRPLPLTVVRAVLRTGEPLYWRPGEAENIFNADPYLREQQPQSVVCLPLRHQDAILGALYLENTRTAGAFPPGRVRILEILLTQAAISLANANLFAEQVRLKEEARRAQENFLQAAKMVSLGTLASGVAHEINNPNNTIMLNSAAIEELWQGLQPALELVRRQGHDLTIKNIPFAELREKVPRLFIGINGATERIKNLSRELRDFARREPMDLHQDVDINHVAQSAVSLLRHLIGRCTDHFTTAYGHDLPLMKGNFQKLEQVIVNLLQNACEALPDRDRKITLATAFNPRTGMVEVEVSDQGCGIAPENLELITDPFFTTRRDEGGTGLGLSIAASIVKDHRGTLEFISEPGLGTRARVSLRPQIPAGE
jgi:signal transduction histidine kinase